LVADERGLFAWKIERPGDDDVKEEIIYSEEIVGMLLAYFKMLAEK